MLRTRAAIAALQLIFSFFSLLRLGVLIELLIVMLMFGFVSGAVVWSSRADIRVFLTRCLIVSRSSVDCVTSSQQTNDVDKFELAADS